MRTIIEDQIKYFTCPDCGGLMEITYAVMKNHVDNCKARQQKAVGVEQQVINLNQNKFTLMDYKCDGCGVDIKVKLYLDANDEIPDIDPPYFCKECDEAL